MERFQRHPEAWQALADKLWDGFVDYKDVSLGDKERSDETMLCFIVSLVAGACIFLGVFYLVKSEITDIFDVLYVLSFDIWVGLLMFLFAYAGLEPMLVK